MPHHHAREILSKLSTLDINSTLHNLTNSVDSLDIRDFHNFTHRASSSANLAPEQLQFSTTQTTYSPSDTVSLTGGWVYDGNGYTDLSTVDFWLLPEGGDWFNIADATSFTPWSEDSNWGSFNYELSNLSAGNYTLWGQAFDQSGAFSNESQVTFSVNQAPSLLIFSTTQDIYNPSETVSLTGGWVYDGDGYTNLAAVDFWLLPESGDWLNIEDATSFTPWSEDSNWGNFNYNLSNLSVGNYTLWGQASDQLGGFSNEYQVTFSVVGVPTIIQLTDNSYSDVGSKISGNNIVWQRWDGNDSEIYYYNGSSITQLTNNSYNDYNPQISGNNIVWERYDGNDNEIYYYNGSTTIQLTDNRYNGFSQISGNNIVWESYDGNDNEIYFYNGTTTTQLTNNSYSDSYPQISGNSVVWIGYDGNDDEIYYYDGSTTTQLTNNIYTDYFPQISGNNIVWESYDGNDYEIYYYDGSSITQLTNNSFSDSYPQISGNNVVWIGYGGGNYKIYYYNGSTTIQLTNTSNYYPLPQISGNNVVWSSSDGNDFEIYYYNGSTTTQLTNNSEDDDSPQISGNNVVWVGSDGNDSEIYFYNGSSID